MERKLNDGYEYHLFDGSYRVVVRIGTPSWWPESLAPSECFEVEATCKKSLQVDGAARERIEAAFYRGGEASEAYHLLHDGVFPTPSVLSNAARNYALKHADGDGWVGVKDRLPDRGAVLVWWDKSGFPVVGLLDGYTVLGQNLDHSVTQYTHWRPLPAPPKEGK